jgi:hypothetical protein
MAVYGLKPPLCESNRPAVWLTDNLIVSLVSGLRNYVIVSGPLIALLIPTQFPSHFDVVLGSHHGAMISGQTR